MTIKLQDILLMRGDCLSRMKEIQDDSISACITDLPYSCLNKSNPSAQWDKEIDMPKMWEQVWRVLKPNGACILFGQGLFSAKLMLSQPKLYRYDLIWQKGGRCSGFLNAKKQPLREHEQILVFYRSQPTYNPQMIKCEPHQRNHSRGKNENPTNRCYGDFGKADDFISDEKYPKSVLNFQREHKNFYHPTCKPVALLEWLIKTYSNEGDTILDFTMGSGSTMVACANTNRKGIGIELMEEYYDIAVKRVKESITNTKNLFNYEN